MIIDTSNALAAPGSSRGYACLSVACRSIAPPGCAAGGCPRRARRALRPPKCRHGVPPKALWPRGRLPPARREKGTASSRRGPWPAGPSGVGLPPPGAPPRAASGLWVLPPSGGGSGVGDGLAPRGPLVLSSCRTGWHLARDHTTRSLFRKAVSAARGRGCLAAPPAPTLALAELTESPSRGGWTLTGEELETQTNGAPRDRAKGAGTCQTPASAQPSPSEWTPGWGQREGSPGPRAPAVSELP